MKVTVNYITSISFKLVICVRRRKNDDKKNKDYVINLAYAFKHIKNLQYGHYLTYCTHINIYNTQIVALETEKVEKITQDSDVNQWIVMSINGLKVLYSKTKVFH